MIRSDKPDLDLQLSRPEEEESSVVPRLWYLMPNRYFRFYFLCDKRTHESCWIPEGFQQ